MSGTRRVEWHGIDDPSRKDAALVALGRDSLAAVGGSVTDTWVSSWSLRTGPGWVTRELDVTTAGPGWRRHLTLRRSEDGAWTADASADGPAELPDPGLPDPDAVAGALDCDLGLCPLTNAMPILRLGLLQRPVAETELTMAWVEMPSLAVHPSRQLYGSAAPDLRLRHEVDYSSEDRTFRARLTVEPNGLVLDYPQLARRSG